jgi:hypothetical protein
VHRRDDQSPAIAEGLGAPSQRTPTPAARDLNTASKSQSRHTRHPRPVRLSVEE